MKKNKIITIILLTIIFILITIASIFIFKELKEVNFLRGENYIRRYVNKNITELEEYVNKYSESNQDELYEDLYKTSKGCNEDSCYVKFEVSSIGIVTSGCYKGFYYSENDIIHNYGFTSWDINGDDINDYLIIPSESDTYDYVQIKKIIDNWYYYNLCY